MNTLDVVARRKGEGRRGKGLLREPKDDAAIILRHEILQKEKIDIALKVQKQIEEFFVFLQDGRERAFLSLIESSDAFQR